MNFVETGLDKSATTEKAVRTICVLKVFFVLGELREDPESSE